jgi:hypothetical protein
MAHLTGAISVICFSPRIDILIIEDVRFTITKLAAVQSADFYHFDYLIS